MIGGSSQWGPILGDYSLGFGYSFLQSDFTLTAQASIGFILNIF
jgi:hypothetical protein